MSGFFRRLWIVAGWLRAMARRGELKAVLKRGVVMTVNDAIFLLQLTLSRFLVRVETHKRRRREEMVKRETFRRQGLLALRRLAKKTL